MPGERGAGEVICYLPGLKDGVQVFIIRLTGTGWISLHITWEQLLSFTIYTTCISFGPESNDWEQHIAWLFMFSCYSSLLSFLFI